MNALLQIEEIGKSWSGPQGIVRALDGISLVLHPREFVAVQGPSGCGKTTLLLAAGTLLQPTRGRVILKGLDAYAMSPGERAQLRATNVGFVFQQFHLVPYLSVLDNILTPSLAVNSNGAAHASLCRKLCRKLSPKPSSLQTGRAPRAQAIRALELAAQFGLSDRLRHVPAAISTGERQRVALARALLNAPALLLADEPTGNLDEQNGRAVLQALSDFARAGGAVLLVTHESRAADFASRIMKMDRGKFR